MTDLTSRFTQWMSQNDDASDPATPAATVVVLRDSAHGPEVLMVQRNAKGSFASNWVFPGGKVDPEDWNDNPDDPVGAGRVAASREAFEEADVALQAGDLVPFSHWMPPREVPRRFSTWFFLGHAPAGTDGEVTIDGAEIVDHLWVRPTEALTQHADGKVELVPPTWITLHDLVNFDSASAAVAATKITEPRFYVTRMIPGEHHRTVVWHEDAAHASGDLATPGGRHRLTIKPGAWQLERS